MAMAGIPQAVLIQEQSEATLPAVNGHENPDHPPGPQFGLEGLFQLRGPLVGVRRRLKDGQAFSGQSKFAFFKEGH